jgi:hypothetical protein
MRTKADWLSLCIPVGITQLIPLDRPQSPYGVSNGSPFIVSLGALGQRLQPYKENCFCGIHALPQGWEIAFTKRSLKLALPVWIFHGVRC